MANDSALVLTIINVVFTCLTALTLFASLLVLHRIWQHALNLQYLIGQLKTMAHERHAEAQQTSLAPSTVTNPGRTPVVPWPTSSSPVSPLSVPAPRPRPQYVGAEAHSGARKDYQIVRQ